MPCAEEFVVKRRDQVADTQSSRGEKAVSFEKVLLVNPSHHAEWRGVTPHIGQAYLAETLSQQGIEYDVLDMNLGYGLRHLRRKMESFQPDLVGVSLISLEYKRLYGLLSSTMTERPAFFASMAHERPEGPPPTTIKSAIF